MKKILLSITVLTSSMAGSAQSIHEKLDAKVQHLLADEQMKHAMLGFYVVNSTTNKPVYTFNDNTGMAPASTQKIFTSIAALDTLGVTYRYKTEIGYTGQIKDSVINGNLVIVGYGDPSFGSWRYATTKREYVLHEITSALLQAGIHTINGDIILNDSKFSYQAIPGGWPWDDIGNYYGAGTWGINWNENQYDVVLNPGDAEGDKTEIAETKPVLQTPLVNNVTTGPRGSGDNSNIFMPPYGSIGFAEGTVPAREKNFTVSGSMPYPAVVFGKELLNALAFYGIKMQGNVITGASLIKDGKTVPFYNALLFTHYSPQLDSLVYWFLQKSINLYGEDFAKTIAYETTGLGSTEKGVEAIRNFWQQHGIEKSSIKIIDGSGLSPANRVTPMAEVEALQYARQRPWFGSFYNDLPTYNHTKMKSGTIGGVKAFSGYQTSADGVKYTFSIIINNYDGSMDAVIKKMFEVLDVLKQGS